MNGLHVGLDLTGPYKDVIEHFAPSGLAVDLLSNAEITRDDCNTNLDAAVRGLGRQNLKIALQGDLLTIAKQAAGTDKLDEKTSMFIHLYCHGTVDLTCDWVLGKYQATPEELAEVFEKSLPEPLRKYLIE